MEMICSSETSVGFQRTIRRYIPEDRTLHNYGCENLKSFKGTDCYLSAEVSIVPLLTKTTKIVPEVFCFLNDFQLLEVFPKFI
jgi:hypothetical protein